MNDLHGHRIPKKHIAAVKQPRSIFEIPKTNHFFQRIRYDKGVLSHSQRHEVEPQEDSNFLQETHEPTLSKSLSLHLSRKGSHIRPEKTLHQIQSLPKIQKKLPQVTNEIIKSELGCFNYFEIVRRMDEEKQKQKIKKVGKNNLTRLSSFLSEDEGLLEEGLEQKDEVDVSKYEEYDHNLMEPEPVIYRRRLFKLKHKADWCISSRG